MVVTLKFFTYISRRSSERWGSCKFLHGSCCICWLERPPNCIWCFLPWGKGGGIEIIKLLLVDVTEHSLLVWTWEFQCLVLSKLSTSLLICGGLTFFFSRVVYLFNQCMLNFASDKELVVYFVPVCLNQCRIGSGYHHGFACFSLSLSFFLFFVFFIWDIHCVLIWYHVQRVGCPYFVFIYMESCPMFS